MSGVQRRRLVEAGDRLVGPAELLQQRAAVEPVGDGIRIERQRLVEARQRLGGRPASIRILARLPWASAKFGVAGERLVEGVERLRAACRAGRSAWPMQVVHAGLPRPKRERAAGELDALLELALLAGDHGDVIERLGVLRVDAQHLRVAVHGELSMSPWRWWNRPCWISCSAVLGSAHGAGSKQAWAGMPSARLASPRKRREGRKHGMAFAAESGKHRGVSAGQGPSMKDILDRLEKRRDGRPRSAAGKSASRPSTSAAN